MKYKLRKKVVAVMAGSMIVGSMPIGAMATETVELTGAELEQFLVLMEEDESADMAVLEMPESDTVELMSDLTMIDEEEVPGEWVTVEGVVGGQIKFDSETGTITDTESTITSANIPSTIGGVTVKGIGEAVFRARRLLESVSIPSSVETIGSEAFRNCTALESVSLPSSVETIGIHAFDGCTALESVNIPSSVTSIGEAGFSGRISLKMISIPSRIRLIYADVFADCDALADVYFEGTEAEWNTMTIRTGNDALLNARVHFNSTMPTNQPVITLGNDYTNGQTIEIELQDVDTFAEITATADDYEGTALDSSAVDIVYSSSDLAGTSVEDFATAKAYLSGGTGRTVTVTVTATDGVCEKKSVNNIQDELSMVKYKKHRRLILWQN